MVRVLSCILFPDGNPASKSNREIFSSAGEERIIDIPTHILSSDRFNPIRSFSIWIGFAPWSIGTCKFALLGTSGMGRLKSTGDAEWPKALSANCSHP